MSKEHENTPMTAQHITVSFPKPNVSSRVRAKSKLESLSKLPTTIITRRDHGPSQHCLLLVRYGPSGSQSLLHLPQDKVRPAADRDRVAQDRFLSSRMQ